MVEKGVIKMFDQKLNNFKEAISLIRRMKNTNDLNHFNFKNNKTDKIIIENKVNHINSKSTQNFNLPTPKFYTSQHIENKFSNNLKEEDRIVKYTLLTSSDNNLEKLKSLTFPKIKFNLESNQINTKDNSNKQLNRKGLNLLKKDNTSNNSPNNVSVKLTDSNNYKRTKIELQTESYNEFNRLTHSKKSMEVKFNQDLNPSYKYNEIPNSISIKKSVVSKNIVKNQVKKNNLSEMRRPKNFLVINNSNKALDSTKLFEIDSLFIPKLKQSNKSRKDKVINNQNESQFSYKNIKLINERFSSEGLLKIPDLKDLSPWSIYENED
jgi:hypothetical protein